jgi:hypothetical protein
MNTKIQPYSQNNLIRIWSCLLVVSSLCLHQWVVLYWHAAVITLANAMKLAPIEAYWSCDYIINWVFNYYILFIQLDTKFGCFINTEFFNCVQLNLFIISDITCFIFSIHIKKWFSSKMWSEIFGCPEFVSEVLQCSLNLVENNLPFPPMYITGHNGHCSLYTQIQIIVPSSLFKVFSYSIICGVGYVGIWVIQQFCNVGCFENFFFLFT